MSSNCLLLMLNVTADDKWEITERCFRLDMNFVRKIPSWALRLSHLLFVSQTLSMAALQTTAAEKHIFDQGIEATFLGESSTGSKLYTGDLKASFCIGSVPNGGTFGSHRKSYRLYPFSLYTLVCDRICCYCHAPCRHAALQQTGTDRPSCYELLLHHKDYTRTLCGRNRRHQT